MAESVLGINGNPLRCIRCTIRTSNRGVEIRKSGTLFLTILGNLVLVRSKGILYSRYQIDPEIGPWRVQDITSISEVARFWGQKTIEIKTSSFDYEITFERTVQAEEWENELKHQVSAGKEAREKAIRELRSSERVSFDELKEILKVGTPPGHPSLDDAEIVDFLQRSIGDGLVEGFIDKERRVFTHIAAYKQKTEVVQYNIVSSFDFSADGLLRIKCPSCGSSSVQRQKSSDAKCEHCGTTYVIPLKILDLI